MHMVRKGQVEEIHDVISEVEFLNRIMCKAAKDLWRSGISLL